MRWLLVLMDLHGESVCGSESAKFGPVSVGTDGLFGGISSSSVAETDDARRYCRPGGGVGEGVRVRPIPSDVGPRVSRLEMYSSAPTCGVGRCRDS